MSPKETPPASQDVAGSEKLSAARIASAFQGEMPRGATTAQYGLGLTVVAILMVLLPLIYVGLIALVAYGTVYHAPVVGAILFLFMIKPIFARPGKVPPRLSLDPKAEPLLFRFVGEVCLAVRAPLPRRIDVDCDVNASASFRRGALSFLGNDLVLTIGLPIVSGLTLRQFAGILAHEFGHFSQGAAMRLTYVIRSVNAWFARVVYERDAWDERLIRWSEDVGGRIGIVLLMTRGMVWLTRRILWALMLCGHAISSFMLRQMEYDADLCEARLAGSESFSRTMREVVLLSAACNKAYADLREAWHERRLGDDFPALVVANRAAMPEETERSIAGSSLSEETGTFDSHPANKDRIRRVEAAACPGIFRLETLARDLFDDFGRLAQAATWALYEQILGDEVRKENLVPTESLVKRQSEVQDGVHAYLRFFQLCPDDGVAVSLEDISSAPADARAAVEELRALRAEFVAVAAKGREIRTELEAVNKRRIQLCVARALSRANVPFDPAEAGLKEASERAIEAASKAADDVRAAIRERLAPLQKLLARRWSLALQLLLGPGGGEVLRKHTASRDEVARLVQADAGMASIDDDAVELRRAHVANGVLVRWVTDGGNRPTEKLVAALQNGARECHRDLSRLRSALARTDYPFEHARGKIALGVHLIEALPADVSNPGETFSTAEAALDRLDSVSVRVRGRLALLGEAAETEIAGLPPLPEPKDA